MATIDTLGATASSVQRKINPRFVPNGIHLVERDVVTVATAGTHVVAVTGRAYVMNELSGLRLISSGVHYTVASNTADGVLTVTATVSLLGATATIQGYPILWRSDEFEEVARRKAGLVLAALPERYRRLLRRVEGEVIVRRATEGQTTATLTWAPSSNSAAAIEIWRNPGPWTDRTRAAALDFGTTATGGDFHLGTVTTSGTPTTTVHFHIGASATEEGTGLTEDDIVVASYDHNLTTTSPTTTAVPALLTELCENLIAHEAMLAHFGGAEREFPPALQARHDETLETLRSMRRAGEEGGQEFGIDELDAIELMVETRTPVTSAYGSPPARRT